MQTSQKPKLVAGTPPLRKRIRQYNRQAFTCRRWSPIAVKLFHFKPTPTGCIDFACVRQDMLHAQTWRRTCNERRSFCGHGGTSSTYVHRFIDITVIYALRQHYYCHAICVRSQLFAQISAIGYSTCRASCSAWMSCGRGTQRLGAGSRAYESISCGSSHNSSRKYDTKYTS